MALNIELAPAHYCRKCLTPTAMVADTGGRTRQPGDWVLCLQCSTPHIWEGDSVRVAEAVDAVSLSREKRAEMLAFAERLRDPEYLVAQGIARWKEETSRFSEEPQKVKE